MKRWEVSLLVILFFVSGFAALVYQVLWMRELGLLFGSTAQAAALTIAVFFTGLASGGWFWGKRAPYFSSSLRWFGFLEIGIGITALSHFILVDTYHQLYPIFYSLVGDSPVLDTSIKALIAVTLLLPPSFLMGGTLPLMVQHLVRQRKDLATQATQFYAVNTLGSATGTLASAFVFPLTLGFQNAYLLAVSLDIVVGSVALFLSGYPATNDKERSKLETFSTTNQTLPRKLTHISPVVISGIAFSSGFASLGIEVIWTRLFSQVLHNSAYTYSVVLATFLLALATGSAIAHGLARFRQFPPLLILGLLLFLAGLATAISPWVFYEVTDGLSYIGRGLGWWDYLFNIAGVAFVVMFLPGMILGTVLPYLIRILEADPRQPSEIIGRLMAADTVGGILGSVGAGFLLLPLVGSWRTLLVLAAIYPLMLGGIALSRVSWLRSAIAVSSIALTIIISGMELHPLQAVTFGAGQNDQLVAMKEGSHANVAVVDTARGGRAIRVNTYYTLGSSQNLHLERNQSVIPLMNHSQPDDLFYLGMGTGISAGAAMPFPVKHVTVCEILPEVVSLAEAHFGEWTNGLFTDERVTIHAEDGRNCLSRSPQTYNLIISDLFTPWKQGTGNLYTLENYQIARERLKPDGVYVQWIPLYQVSEREFGIIARTMSEVFPQVVLWRGDLGSSRSIVALVGHKQEQTLDPNIISERGQEMTEDWTTESLQALLLRLYVGNITASGLFEDYPLNTDTFPYIEYLAPETHRKVQARETRFLIGHEREQLYEKLRSAVPPESDPYLANLNSEQYGYIRAGHHYSRHNLLQHIRQTRRADPHLEVFERNSPQDTWQRISPARWLIP
ncbi:hypothetical protein FRE64_06260 [Euhalothece natronophila Z-M001]|uniref:PABS domain-containing protein n=1 Tax=Euhalothece natronophila Z-M001 TaxID=522448 RepID=A0A5B8NKQ0_9CHRO|nr:fused MFS/spermidine synthase [Euhalothece natronophila]QDZ39566.1 hypothetical protein FRE64_06260 [Euhalothece natronophila Z-M001]